MFSARRGRRAPRWGESTIGEMPGVARYDGLAEWYQDFRPALNPHEREALGRLLGPGEGRCLDVGAAPASRSPSCPSSAGPPSASTGRTRTSTTFPALLRELVRVLRRRGPFVYLGAHPCFVRLEELEPGTCRYPYMVAIAARRTIA